jgi:hypothetical protein
MAVVTNANRIRLVSPMDHRTRWEMRGLAYAAVEGRYGLENVRLWSAGGARAGTLLTNALPGMLQVRREEARREEGRPSAVWPRGEVAAVEEGGLERRRG